MKKNRIKLNESYLNRVINESLNKVINEMYCSMNPDGTSTCIKDKQYFDPNTPEAKSDFANHAVEHDKTAINLENEMQDALRRNDYKTYRHLQELLHKRRSEIYSKY